MFEIQSGTQKRAIKCTIYGPEGIGKSSLAAQFPDPLFIDTEDSTIHMDVKRLKKPSSWTELIQMLNWVKQSRPCSTIIIDTADWAQTLAEKEVINEKGVNSIEDIGYGKGYVLMRDKFGNMLDKLSEIKDVGINVVLTAHSQIKKFEDPAEMGAYDRYELKLAEKSNASIAGVVKEWADMVLFLNYEIISVKASDMGDKYKAQGGKRVMHTTHHPAWDAKNRYGLPDKLPLDFTAISGVIPDLVKEQPKPEPVAEQPKPETPMTEPPITSEQQEIINMMDQADNAPVTIPEYLPEQLKDLMKANDISEDELKAVAGVRGHFPINTDFSTIAKTSPDYFTGGLVANWENVLNVVKEIRSNPQMVQDLWIKVVGDKDVAYDNTADMNIKFNQ